jgi:hypothetical protein
MHEFVEWRKLIHTKGGGLKSGKLTLSHFVSGQFAGRATCYHNWISCTAVQ